MVGLFLLRKSNICEKMFANYDSFCTFAPRLVRWVSGLNQQFAKLSYWKRYRGFESPLHR